jgi:hypothetical protein
MQRGAVMDQKKSEVKKLSTGNTKQEMLDAYNAVAKQLREKEEAELKPEKKVEEKRVVEVLKTAEDVSVDGIATHIASLKTEVGKTLAQVSDKMEAEAEKLSKVHQAVEIKEKELQELYGIEKEALALAALIESQNRKREEFETKMAADQEDLETKMTSDREAFMSKLALEREALMKEIEVTRSKWAEEKKAKDAETKEWDAAEKKKREREKEEFDYGFKREQRLTKDVFEDEKATLERETQARKAEMEAELATRERAVADREQRVADLENRVSSFPGELDVAVKKATQEASARLSGESKNREELLKREFDGERNVLTTKIEALEKTAKEQHEQISRLMAQLEKSYEKVEDIAIKAVQSVSASQSSANLQQMIAEQTRKQGQEK